MGGVSFGGVTRIGKGRETELIRETRGSQARDDRIGARRNGARQYIEPSKPNCLGCVCPYPILVHHGQEVCFGQLRRGPGGRLLHGELGGRKDLATGREERASGRMTEEGAIGRPGTSPRSLLTGAEPKRGERPAEQQAIKRTLARLPYGVGRQLRLPSPRIVAVDVEVIALQGGVPPGAEGLAGDVGHDDRLAALLLIENVYFPVGGRAGQHNEGRRE